MKGRTGTSVSYVNSDIVLMLNAGVSGSCTVSAVATEDLTVTGGAELIFNNDNAPFN